MKFDDIARIDAPSLVAARQSESAEKSSEDFRSMLESINGVSVSDPSASVTASAELSSPSVAPVRASRAVSQGKALAAYRHDRFLPLKNRQTVARQQAVNQPQATAQTTAQADKVYRPADAVPTSGNDSQAAEPAAYSKSSAEVFGKIRGWFSRLFFGDQPKTRNSEAAQAEGSKGIFGAIAGFFKNFGKLAGSAKPASETEDPLKECTGTDFAKVYGGAAGKEQKEAVFAAAGGQNLPVRNNRTAARSQSAAANQEHGDASGSQSADTVCSLGNSRRTAGSLAGLQGYRRKAGRADESSLSVRYPGSTDRIHRAIMQAADRYQLPAELIAAIIKVESDFDPRAVSSKGAKGLMQLMPTTARDLQVRNCFNVEQNIDGGSRYLRYLLDEFDGELRMALAAYHAGPGAVKKHQGIPPYRQTRNYLHKVLSHLYASSR